ncbi:hypothetical protein [Nonomuraea typhae]|uniref:hypothetical protein n=1 Tax=Nonomuraea typhae TaxID=2603600 RepID=UPI0012F90D59|nr:hypothetical protein [Nonomuraea typhae]
MNLSVRVTLFTCKHCRRQHNNPLTHACRVGMAELGVPASMRKAQKAKEAAARKKNSH